MEADSKEKQPPVKDEEEKSVKNNSDITSEELVDKDSKMAEKSTGESLFFSLNCRFLKVFREI